MNKKGWVKVVEAFLAAVLILVVLILVINKQNENQQNPSQIISNSEVSILRVIESNNTLRGDIISVQNSLLPLNSGNSSFPAEVNNTLNSIVPNYLSCQAQICGAGNGDSCDYWKDVKAEVYSQDVLITANLTGYNPRKFRIFCEERSLG